MLLSCFQVDFDKINTDFLIKRPEQLEAFFTSNAKILKEYLIDDYANSTEKGVCEYYLSEEDDDSDDDEIDEEDFDDEDDKSSDEDFPEYDLATIYYEYKPRFSQKKEPTEDFTRLLDKWEEILQREDVKVSVWNNPEKIPVWEGKDDAGTRQTNFEYKTPQKDAILKFDCGRVYGLNSKYTNECFLKVSYQKGERKIEGSVTMLYPSGFTGSEAAFKLSVGNLLAHIGRTDLAKLVAKFQAKKYTEDAERRRKEEELEKQKWEQEQREQDEFEDDFDNL